MSPTLPSPGPVVTISQDPGIVTVIERFDIPSECQDEAVGTSRIHIEKEWAEQPLFVAAVLLRSRESDGVSCYSQWKRPAGVAPDAPVPSQSLASALKLFELLDTRTYSVDFSAHPVSIAPVTLISFERTPCAHFGLFTVKHDAQNRMLELARGNAPRALGTPGLVAINFHRSLDGMRVVNFGLWASLDEFDALVQRPGFKDDDLYWTDVADFQHDFLDVVSITTARVVARPGATRSSTTMGEASSRSPR